MRWSGGLVIRGITIVIVVCIGWMFGLGADGLGNWAPFAYPETGQWLV